MVPFAQRILFCILPFSFWQCKPECHVYPTPLINMQGFLEQLLKLQHLDLRDMFPSLIKLDLSLVAITLLLEGKPLESVAP